MAVVSAGERAEIQESDTCYNYMPHKYNFFRLR